MKIDIFRVIQFLSAFGVILAVYLLTEQIFRFPSVCSISATVNCDAIISGAVSHTLGIPTPLYGLTGYVVMFFAATLKKSRLLAAMATFGLAFCLWIGFRELFELHVVCPICLACQATIIAVFILALYRLLHAHDGPEAAMLPLS